MKKILNKVSLITMAMFIALPTTASAAVVKSNPIQPQNNYVKISEEQIIDNEVVIALEANKPVQVELPDGRVDTFTYYVDNCSRSGEQKVGVIRSLRLSHLELWCKAKWENRKVSVVGDAKLDFTGVNSEITEEDTYVEVRTSSSQNPNAIIRTEGVLGTNIVKDYYEYVDSFDFEMWLDPADSTQGFIHINI